MTSSKRPITGAHTQTSPSEELNRGAVLPDMGRCPQDGGVNFPPLRLDIIYIYGYDTPVNKNERDRILSL
ncbi:hypothetical protein KAZ93_01935 [Patescibacteria group bacterium]|nr:hypothetical protein [Patescibacteria group bacterium]